MCEPHNECSLQYSTDALHCKTINSTPASRMLLFGTIFIIYYFNSEYIGRVCISNLTRLTMLVHSRVVSYFLEYLLQCIECSSQNISGCIVSLNKRYLKLAQTLSRTSSLFVTTETLWAYTMVGTNFWEWSNILYVGYHLVFSFVTITKQIYVFEVTFLKIQTLDLQTPLLIHTLKIF